MLWTGEPSSNVYDLFKICSYLLQIRERGDIIIVHNAVDAFCDTINGPYGSIFLREEIT